MTVLMRNFTISLVLRSQIRIGAKKLGNIRVRRGVYRDAAKAYEQALNEPNAHFSPVEYATIKQDFAIAFALKDIPMQQRRSYQGTSLVNATQGKGGLDYRGMIYVDVQVNRYTEAAIFDTMASYCVSSESYARRHRLRMLPDLISITSSTGETINAMLGVADEIKIGDMIFTHVIFVVIKDDNMLLSNAGIHMDSVIGMPVIVALDRVQFSYKDNSMKIGTQSEFPRSDAVPKHNMVLDGLNQHIAFFIGYWI